AYRELQTRGSLQCDAQCQLEKRNRQLAEALGVETDSNGSTAAAAGGGAVNLAPVYARTLLDLWKAYPSFAAMVESRLDETCSAVVSGRSQSRSTQFQAPNRDGRKFIYELAEVYGCEVQVTGAGSDASRTVTVTAKRGRARLPDRKLSAEAQRLFGIGGLQQQSGQHRLLPRAVQSWSSGLAVTASSSQLTTLGRVATAYSRLPDQMDSMELGGSGGAAGSSATRIDYFDFTDSNPSPNSGSDAPLQSASEQRRREDAFWQGSELLLHAPPELLHGDGIWVRRLNLVEQLLELLRGSLGPHGRAHLVPAQVEDCGGDGQRILPGDLAVRVHVVQAEHPPQALVRRPPVHRVEDVVRKQGGVAHGEQVGHGVRELPAAQQAAGALLLECPVDRLHLLPAEAGALHHLAQRRRPVPVSQPAAAAEIAESGADDAVLGATPDKERPGEDLEEPQAVARPQPVQQAAAGWQFCVLRLAPLAPLLRSLHIGELLLQEAGQLVRQAVQGDLVAAGAHQRHDGRPAVRHARHREPVLRAELRAVARLAAGAGRPTAGVAAASVVQALWAEQRLQSLHAAAPCRSWTGPPPAASNGASSAAAARSFAMAAADEGVAMSVSALSPASASGEVSVMRMSLCWPVILFISKLRAESCARLSLAEQFWWEERSGDVLLWRRKHPRRRKKEKSSDWLPSPKPSGRRPLSSSGCRRLEEFLISIWDRRSEIGIWDRRSGIGDLGSEIWDRRSGIGDLDRDLGSVIWDRDLDRRSGIGDLGSEIWDRRSGMRHRTIMAYYPELGHFQRHNLQQGQQPPVLVLTFPKPQLPRPGPSVFLESAPA
uniref:R3H domain-containing protein n=1 Tax=Macrostomum lignano TaxID=282301 RepID=A0A1I8HYQ9_9PLAT